MCERDIVERLRDSNDHLLACGNDYSDVLLDAALEIERLRSELADARRAGWIAGRDAAAEEVLRAINNETDDMDELLDDINALEPPA